MNEIKNFNYLEKLGQGTFGHVYKIFESDKFHAVKQITNEDEDEGICGSAVRELTLLNRLRHHPMILNYESVSTAPSGTVRIVFPLMSCNLFEWMSRQSDQRRFDMMKVLAYRMLILLRDMEDLGILHRDIKPQNILMDEKDVPYLCDFGSGREYFGYDSPLVKDDKNRPPHHLSFSDLHTTSMITYLYRPPEIQTSNRYGSNKYTSKVDMYALGCTLIQVLTRHTPELDRVPDPSEWANELMDFVNKSELKIDILWIRLLKSMICANPNVRLSAKSALNLVFYEKITQDNFTFKPMAPNIPLNIITHPLTEKIIYGVLDKTAKNLDGRIIKSFVSFLAHRVHCIFTRCCRLPTMTLNSKLILLLSCIDLMFKLVDQDAPKKSNLIESATSHTRELVLESDLIYGERYVMYVLNYHLI